MDLVDGKAPSGPAAITVEKHKHNFRAQHGPFSDKPSENITRWLEKAEIYQEAHMIPSLEMASIVIHCIKGEAAVKVQRMLDVPGTEYKHSNHFKEQPHQEAVPYTKFKPRVDAKEEVKDPVSGAIVTYQLHETAGELLKVTSFRIALEEVARLRFNRFRPEEQKTPNSISKQM